MISGYFYVSIAPRKKEYQLGAGDPRQCMLVPP